MVITLKAKEGLEHDNPWEVGQSGLIGNPAAAEAFDGATCSSWSVRTFRTASGYPGERR